MTEKRDPALRLDMSFAEALSRFAATRPKEVQEVIRADRQIKMEAKQGEFQLVHYVSGDCAADFTLDPSNETIWATVQQIADLFGVDRSVVTKHLQNIYDDNELERGATCASFAQVRQEGSRQVTRGLDHYSLDAILSVGYRVSSKRATEFRKYATQVLKNYITQGFAINEARLKDDPHALRELAARVRALRADEINVYKAVRDVFAFASVDYKKDAPDICRFFAKIQDEFTYAVTGQLSSQILLERANHMLHDVGMTSMAGSRPSHADVQKAKNYLDSDELYQLHMLCEQFLLFVESSALRGRHLTMKQLSDKFDDLLRLIGVPVFTEYKDALAERAKRHAIKELELYQNRMVVERNEEKRKLGVA